MENFFERVIFNSIFEYLEENNLLCPNQSGFRPSDSCEYQLLSILHEIHKEVVFSRKSDKLAHPPVLFNNVPVKRCSIQKHLGFHLDEKLNFNHHVKEKITKANKGIGVIKKLSNILPRDALLTIYKSFVRLHLDYGDIMYDQPQNESCNKLESIQYNAALAITGAIRGTSKVKLYKELGLEFLKSRRWFR